MKNVFYKNGLTGFDHGVIKIILLLNNFPVLSGPNLDIVPKNVKVPKVVWNVRIVIQWNIVILNQLLVLIVLITTGIKHTYVQITRQMTRNVIHINIMFHLLSTKLILVIIHNSIFNIMDNNQLKFGHVNVNTLLPEWSSFRKYR